MPTPGGALVPRCPVGLVTLAKPTVVGALIDKVVHEVTPDLNAMVAYGALSGEAHSIVPFFEFVFHVKRCGRGVTRCACVPLLWMGSLVCLVVLCPAYVIGV